MRKCANVHAFAPLLDDAERKGCTGILGIHWRTRAVEEVAGYTFRRAWDARETPRSFFAHFAATSYGTQVADAMTAIHSRLEELGPRWTGAAGQYECRGFAWFDETGLDRLDPEDAPPTPFRNRLLPDAARTAELARLREQVAALSTDATGPRAERFAYLLAQMRWVAAYDAAALRLYPNGEVEALLRRGEALLAAGDAEGARVTGEAALVAIAGSGLGEAVQAYAAAVTNRGELGNVAVMNGKAVVAYKASLRRAERLVGRPLPEALAGTPWPADPIILTPERFDLVAADAAPEMRVMVLARDAPGRVEACVARWGAAAPAATVAFAQERRSVYRGTIPIHRVKGSVIAYWFRVTSGAGQMTETDRWSVPRITTQ